MNNNGDTSVSDEVIDDLKRMKRIVSSHVPNFAKNKFEIPESIQKIIQSAAKDQRILKKTASTHIRNSIQSSQYFGHALNSNHDMDIDMRRQRLSWLNREFPRQNKQNQNKKVFDSQTILQTLEKLRHMNNIQFKNHINRHARSTSLNPTQQSKQGQNLISSQRESSNPTSKIQHKFNNKSSQIIMKEYIKEEDIQEDSQGFVLLQRQYKDQNQLESFEEQNDISEDRNQCQDRQNQENFLIQQSIDKNKQDDRILFKKGGEKSFSPIKPKQINFDMAMELDKNNRQMQEQQNKQNQNQQILQQRSSLITNQQSSQQSQRTRPRIFSEDKKSDWNEGSLMLPAHTLNSSTIDTNSQFLLAKSLSNIQFSHLKQSRYIDYVNHVNSNYEMNNSNDLTKESKQFSSTMKNFNLQQSEEKQACLPLDDICKKNNSQIYGSRMIRKEVDLQKILNARGLISKQNQYTQQQEYIKQSDKYLCQTPWQSQDVIDFEKKLNNREKASLNVYQHQFIKKYLNMKKDTLRKNINSSQNLSKMSQNSNSQTNILHKNLNFKGNGYYLAEIKEVNQSLKRLNKGDLLQQSKQQDLVLEVNSGGNIQYEQIGQKGKFFANSITASEMPKINENTNNCIREVKSYKILKSIINRNQQPNQIPFLQQIKQNEQLKKDKSSNQISYSLLRASDYLDQI